MEQKCIVLFSGGLDSRLAVKLMQERGFEIIGVYFKLPFSCSCLSELEEFVKKEKIKLKVFDCTKGKLFKEYLEIIKKAKHGRGVGFNSCIDCKIFMFKKAKEFADSKKIKYTVSGEVVGQRPMSQKKKKMDLIEKEAGLKDRIIRPLIELGIFGRQRKKQIELAKKFKIKYPHPAGGCLLCEKGLKNRFKLLIKDNMIKEDNLPLISIGRHFVNSKRWIVLGRNEKENEIIEKQKGIRVIPKQIGPSAWVNKKELIPKAKKLIKKYSKHDINEFEIK